MDASDIETFLRSYIGTALWSSHDEATPDGGEPMDANYEAEDIVPETMARMRADCVDFIESAALLLAPFNAESCGHDFWLNRNGHGAGFWDGDYGDAGDALSEACKPCGGFMLYVGDDGKIHGADA